MGALLKVAVHECSWGGMAFRWLAITRLLQGRTLTLALATPLRLEVHPASSRRAQIPTANPVDPAHLLTKLRQHMAPSHQFQQHATPHQLH
jgi:hypothetical protein